VTGAAPRRPAVVRVRVLVSGRVQGVWYRETCRREAERLGVAGWVRNRPDGRVEIEAEGPRPAVDALVGWARRGPPRAVVDTLVVEDLEVGGAAAVRGGGGSGFRVVG
jgi:acylphosphatase